LFQIDPKAWEPQRRGIEMTIDALARGKDVCLYSPTGGGKTFQAIELLRFVQSGGLGGCFYVNRTLLLSQTADRMSAAGLEYGIRAAGYDDCWHPSAPFQVCSIDTERSRVYGKGVWKLHDVGVGGLVVVDEAHIQKSETMWRVIQDYKAAGARIVLLTATPVGLSDWADELIISGKLSEYRACKALVPAVVKSIQQPDLSKVKRNATGEYVIDGKKRKIYTQSIVGDVLERWKKYNPDARPTMLYAPGKPESVWLTERFQAAGVSWCHVDATDAIVDGERHTLTRDLWQDILGRYKDGSIKGLSCRFKLREGIDVPSTYCCILATPIGSLASYIQTIGRVLRYSEETPDTVLVIDHGGNYLRHGSPNHDRDWQAWWTLPEHAISEMHVNQIRDGKTPEPIRCPICEGERAGGRKCPHCFAAGTLVLTSSGWKAIELIEAGESVLTHRNRWRTVNATHHRHGESYVVRGLGHPGLRTTADHAFWSEDGWQRADSVDRLASPAKVEPLPVPECPFPLTAGFFRFVGCWLGDGSCTIRQRTKRPSQRNAVVVLVSAKTDTEVERVTDTIADAGFKPKRHENRTEWQYPIYRVALCEWLTKHFGEYSHGKSIPPWCFGMNREWRESLLRGYMEADGYKTPRSELTANTVSKELALGVKLLAQSLGHGCRLYKADPGFGEIEGRSFRSRVRWIVVVGRKTPVKGRAITCDGDSFYGPVRAGDGAADCDLYDLSVDDDHSYVAEGIVVHNCGHEHEKSKRHVVMENGDLVERDGHLIPPRKVVHRNDTAELWAKMFWGYKNKKLKRSFAQMYGHFVHEHHYSPPRNLPFMPKEPQHWYKYPFQIEFDKLHSGRKESA
jgi:superfamily II DNA or RNA helicase